GYKPVMLLEDTDFTTTTMVTITSTSLPSTSSSASILMATNTSSPKIAIANNSESTTSGSTGADTIINVSHAVTNSIVTSSPRTPVLRTGSRYEHAHLTVETHTSTENGTMYNSIENDANTKVTQKNLTVESTTLPFAFVEHKTPKQNNFTDSTPLSPSAQSHEVFVTTTESPDTHSDIPLSTIETWWQDLVAPDRPTRPKKTQQPTIFTSTSSSTTEAATTVTLPTFVHTTSNSIPTNVELRTVSPPSTTIVTSLRSTMKVTFSKTTTALPYWLIHNKMPEVTGNIKTDGGTQSDNGVTADLSNHLPPFLLRSSHNQAPRSPSQPQAHTNHHQVGSEIAHHRTSWGLNKDLWVRGDTHGVMGLPHGHSAGASDGAVVGAGVVATLVGVALLVGGLMLARGRGKNGQMWEALSYWKEDGEDDVVVSVGECVSGVEVTESEGTLGVVTDTHRGLNNRLYLLMQRDSSTGITPDSLPDLSDSH
ncbi:unnamed protein product, partial [Meganyctiphanes norvegica]